MPDPQAPDTSLDVQFMLQVRHRPGSYDVAAALVNVRQWPRRALFTNSLALQKMDLWSLDNTKPVDKDFDDNEIEW
jgi:hypothetical protein